MKIHHNNDGGFTLVETLLIILVLAVVGFGGYYVWHTQHKKAVASKTQTTNAAPATKKVAMKPSVDPTAGWATYTSQSGFTFKYPTSGWTISGARNPGYTAVTGSQLNGSEYEITLKENTGQGLSKDGNQYYIVMDLGSTSSTSGLDNYVNAKASPSTYRQKYNSGTVTTLSNGIQMWSSNDSSSTGCNTGGSILELVDNSNFYTSLTNGQLMEWQASFCYGFKASSTLSFQQQANSPEATVAKEVLASYKL